MACMASDLQRIAAEVYEHRGAVVYVQLRHSGRTQREYRVVWARQPHANIPDRWFVRHTAIVPAQGDGPAHLYGGAYDLRPRDLDGPERIAAEAFLAAAGDE